MLQQSLPRHEVFAALADPTRVAIIERLSEGAASVGDLAEPMPMSLSAVGQHLRILERSGLVTTAKRGRTRYCALNADRLGDVEQWVRERRCRAKARLDNLENFLAQEGGA